MALLKFLRDYHWTIRNYHLSTNRVEGVERFLMAWGAAVVILRYLVNCFEALGRVTSGKLQSGLAMGEFNLLHLLLMWIVLPLLVTRSAGPGMGLNFRQLLPYPFTRNELFLTALTRVTVMPVFWVLLFFSVFAWLPFLAGPCLPWALAGGVLYLLFAQVLFWLGEISGNLVNLKSSVYLLALRLFLVILFFANFSFSWKEDNVVVFIFSIKFLLLDSPGRAGLLATLAGWFPSSWVRLASLGEAVYLLLFLPLLGFFLALCRGIFTLLLTTGAELNLDLVKRRSLLFSRFFSAATPRSALVARELSERIKAPEFLLCLCLCAAGVYYIFSAPENITNIMQVFFCLIFLIFSSVPFNAFALDGPAFTRYRLLPLKAALLLQAKNRGYFLLSACLLLPLLGLLPLAAPLPALNLALMSGTALLLYAVWGNFTSIFFPAALRHKSAGGTEQAGSGLNALLALGLWVGMLWLYHKLTALPALGCNLLWLLLAVVIYAVTRRRFSLLLEERMEEIAARLE